MKHRKSLAVSASILLAIHATDTQAQSISLFSDGKAFKIEAQQTQTEVKPGWKIADIQLKSSLQRYLWGARAKDYADNARPQFIVDTDTLLLSDMVLIKLKAKKEYRRIPKAEIHDNKRIYVDLSNFRIEAYGNESFLIQPLADLESGEYIFTWTTKETIGDLNDWAVWPFSIK